MGTIVGEFIEGMKISISHAFQSGKSRNNVQRHERFSISNECIKRSARQLTIDLPDYWNETDPYHICLHTPNGLLTLKS